MLQEAFIRHVRETHLFHRGDRLWLAVSGGVDSVVLCELCHLSKFRFEIAHMNFGLRGEESDGDELFVKQLAERYRVPFHTKRTDALQYAAQHKESIQVAARVLRYQWFTELTTESEGLLLTAHHADDNIETMLMNFFRGTGIAGLKGIPASSGPIRRPLLPFSKSELVAFAKQQKLKWRDDSSNATDKYSRNYFRNAIIPLVNKVFPESEHNLLENLKRFSEVDMLYRQALDLHRKKLTEQKGNEIHIPVLKMKKTVPVRTVLYELTRPYHFTAHQADELVHLLDADHGKMVLSPTHRIIKNRGWLIISPLQQQETGHVVVGQHDEVTRFAQGSLHLHRKPAKTFELPSSSLEAGLDHRKIEYPLIVRKWKAGDYFYPLGMKKKKKVSRLLIDLKLSPTDKEKVWVMESGKRICWVIGLRIDDRFKLVESTKEVLQIKFEKQAAEVRV